MVSYKHLFNRARVAGKQGVQLLKELEEYTAEIFRAHAEFEAARHVLGAAPERVELVLKAVLSQNYTAIVEYSADAFKLFEVTALRQDMMKQFVNLALEDPGCGFNAFERALLSHCFNIGHLYTDYYIDWSKAVRDPVVTAKVEADLAAGRVIPAEFENHYTIVSIDEKGNYSHVAYASYFKDSLKAVLNAFDNMVADLEKVGPSNDIEKPYIPYLRHYRACLAEKGISKLESMFEQLDILWMATKGPIQIVHDIEYGDADPLRAKVSPDFSLRMIDSSYEEENKIIQVTQRVLVEYFSTRDTRLARGGLAALKNSFAAIYLVPLQAGVSMHFRFSGQSLPNRANIRESHGVKIYLDPVSSSKRINDTIAAVGKVCPDAQALAPLLNPISILITHVAPHEVGHAIYSICNLEGEVSMRVTTLLEEPRADLTAFHSVNLLYKNGLMSAKEVTECMLAYAMNDLRRFLAYENSATRPYAISATMAYKMFEEEGLVERINNGTQIRFNGAKALAVVERATQKFESILDMEDRRDCAGLEKTLDEMTARTPLIDFLIEKIKAK